MPAHSRQHLQQEFRDGERPSGADFLDLIDSFVNLEDDGVRIAPEAAADSSLEVPRGLHLGDSNSSVEGTLRYRGGTVQVHDGSGWVDIGGIGGGAFQTVGGGSDIAYSDGNVGINTGSAAPEHRLQVELGNNSTPTERVRFGNAVLSNGVQQDTNSACFYHRDHPGREAMALRQTPEGAVLINAPGGQTISLAQNRANVRLGISNTGKVIVGSNIDIGPDDCRLAVNGNACKTQGGEVWILVSDARAKEDIRALDLGLEQILAIRPVRYRYNGRFGTRAGEEGIGIIGQEIEQVLPETTRHVPLRGDADTPADALLVYDGSALKYVLVRAVQQLAARIEALEAALARRPDSGADDAGAH
jgi:hypothetical protein